MNRKYFGWLALFTSLFILFAPRSGEADSLRQQLEEKSKSGKTDEKTRAIMESAIESLRKEKIASRAKKVGDSFPDFTLKNAKGADVNLATLLKTGPVVVTFYRGSWCPYCNIQLMEYQKHLSAWEAKGAKVLAISPELPELSAALAEKRALTYDLLFDKNNELAKNLGLAFGLKEDLKQVYEKFGIDLAKSQGNSSWQLPISATYVIGKDKKVKFAFVEVDYKKRAEPSDISAALAK